MKISPYYDEIKTRTLELLNADDGYNGYSHEEILSWKKGGWVSRNTISVAICHARDEVYARFVTGDMSVEQRRAAYRNAHFTKANFHKVEAEIVRVIKKARNELMTRPVH